MYLKWLLLLLFDLVYVGRKRGLFYSVWRWGTGFTVVALDKMSQKWFWLLLIFFITWETMTSVWYWNLAIFHEMTPLMRSIYFSLHPVFSINFLPITPQQYLLSSPCRHPCVAFKLLNRLLKIILTSLLKSRASNFEHNGSVSSLFLSWSKHARTRCRRASVMAITSSSVG